MKTGAQTGAQYLTYGLSGRGAGKLWGEYARVHESGASSRPHSRKALARVDPTRPDAGLRKFSWQSDD